MKTCTREKGSVRHASEHHSRVGGRPHGRGPQHAHHQAQRAKERQRPQEAREESRDWLLRKQAGHSGQGAASTGSPPAATGSPPTHLVVHAGRLSGAEGVLLRVDSKKTMCNTCWLGKALGRVSRIFAAAQVVLSGAAVTAPTHPPSFFSSWVYVLGPGL